jgi:outer membrane lipoprotein-sorting protein
MCRKIVLFFLCIVLFISRIGAQDVSVLVKKVRDKIGQVNSYVADGIMKTNVDFLKVPEAHVKIYFKKPDKLKIKNENGISLVPKNILDISLNNLLNGNYTPLKVGSETINGNKVEIVKLIPSDDNGEIVLSTLYIDEEKLLIVKSKVATKQNGSFEMEMSYGKYSNFALPDKLVCTFNTKDYKLPKGVTFDYDDGSKKTAVDPTPNQTGKVEIVYRSYEVNEKIPDTVFEH